jgi:NAD(P)H dehydrogenase (quinone)
MNVFVVLAHPEPKSFNGALFRLATENLRDAGHAVRTSDLYRMGYNPVSDRHNFTGANDPDFLKLQLEEMHATETGTFAPEVEAEIEKLEWCDLMIWQSPLWWFGLPAILKGWADRTLAMGRTYGGGRRYENGVFRGKRAMLSMTTGGGSDSYVKGGANGDIDAIVRPINRGIFQFVGFDVLAPAWHWAPVRQDDATRAKMLDAYAARLRGIESETPIEVGEY